MDEANGLCTDRNGSDGYAFSTLNESTQNIHGTLAWKNRGTKMKKHKFSVMIITILAKLRGLVEKWFYICLWRVSNH